MNRNRIAARLQTSRMPKLTRDSTPRAPTPGQAKFPIKVNPDAGLIAAHLGKAAAAEGLRIVDEQHARRK